jgi:hypothetical protein
MSPLANNLWCGLGCGLALAWSSVTLAAPQLEGPIPGSPPGDRNAANVEDTYPFFSALNLAQAGYIEEEYYLSGEADAYATNGNLLAEDVPYRTRIIVRRPVSQASFNGSVLLEWQNVTAGNDLDALWTPEQLMREGYVWVGVSAQRVGVDHLRGWSPARYGSLDVTGAGVYTTDQLSYDIFAQAAEALREAGSTGPLAGLDPEKWLAIGASQSAGRMTTYYNSILPQVSNPVFDGYAFIVGSAPSRVGTEPVFHVLSETDVRTPFGRRADSEVYRRWEVAGAAHSGYEGQVYRRPISERDLPGGQPQYNCTQEPFSRVPQHYVIAAAYGHLAAWVDGIQPPSAPYLEFSGLTKVRNELGLAQGGIQLSQVVVPTAINTGDNSGESFCFLFGSYNPLDQATLSRLYRNHGQYVSRVSQVNSANVDAGYLLRADAQTDMRRAAQSDIGKK